MFFYIRHPKQCYMLLLPLLFILSISARAENTDTFSAASQLEANQWYLDMITTNQVYDYFFSIDSSTVKNEPHCSILLDGIPSNRSIVCLYTKDGTSVPLTSVSTDSDNTLRYCAKLTEQTTSTSTYYLQFSVTSPRTVTYPIQMRVVFSKLPPAVCDSSTKKEKTTSSTTKKHSQKKSSTEKSSTEKSSAKKSSTEKSSTEKSSTKKFSTEKSSTEKSSTEKSSTEKSSKKKSISEISAAKKSTQKNTVSPLPSPKQHVKSNQKKAHTLSKIQRDKPPSPSPCSSKKSFQKKKLSSPTSIALSPHFLRLKIGQTFRLSLTLKPKKATKDNMIWQSSNPHIIKLHDGKIYAVSEGIVSVFVYDKTNRARCASCTIRVTV